MTLVRQHGVPLPYCTDVESHRLILAGCFVVVCEREGQPSAGEHCPRITCSIAEDMFGPFTGQYYRNSTDVPPHVIAPGNGSMLIQILAFDYQRLGFTKTSPFNTSIEISAMESAKLGTLER